MPEYDDFAETYQHWSVKAPPYRQIELYSFFKVLGSVRGLSILDLAAGEGRISRLLMEGGAASVLGTDISPEMVRRAKEQNDPATASRRDPSWRTWPALRYIVLDARDRTFQLEAPVDLVTAAYLFHYAPSEEDLGLMAELIARNLKGGGRFVTYTINPDYNLGQKDPRLSALCGFEYEAVVAPEYHLIIDNDRVSIWQWSQEAHETHLLQAGLTDIRWHPLQAPPGAPELASKMDFYLTNPSCIVLSAVKSG